MTVASIDISLVDDSIPTIVSARVLEYLRANCVLGELVARDWENEVAQAGNVISIPTPGNLSANTKTANTIVTLQQPADSKVQITLNQHKEASFLLEDPARMFARPDWFNIYLKQGVDVIVENIEASIAALYAGLSQTIDVSGASGPMTAATWREAKRLLNSAKAPRTERFAVLQEDAEYDATAIEEIINSAYKDTLGGAARDSFITRAYGFDVFMDQKIAVASSKCRNLFFQKYALALAMRPLAKAPSGLGVLQNVMAENGYGVRTTISYNPDYLGLQCTVDALWGVGELRDDHGVVVITDEK